MNIVNTSENDCLDAWRRRFFETSLTTAIQNSSLRITSKNNLSEWLLRTIRWEDCLRMMLENEHVTNIWKHFWKHLTPTVLRDIIGNSHSKSLFKTHLKKQCLKMIADNNCLRRLLENDTWEWYLWWISGNTSENTDTDGSERHHWQQSFKIRL